MELAGLRIITIQSVSMRRRDDKRHNFVIGGPRDGYINVPPRYLQAALVYIHIIHNIPYAESRFSDWKERILRAWPKVLLYRPGLGPVENQDSTCGLVVIQALDGTIGTDRRPMGEDGAALSG
jgi:hypothetical protein